MSDCEQIKGLVREFLFYLDAKDTSYEGREFYPNRISSCRANDGRNMVDILSKLKRLVNET